MKYFLLIFVLFGQFRSLHAQEIWSSGSGCENKQFPRDYQEKIKKIKEFKQKCGNLGQKEGNDPKSKNIILNDYTKNPSMLYVFDESGTCLYSVPVAYGKNSAGQPPAAGCSSGSNKTPAGYHMLTKHYGSRYNESNSYGMTDLQGQGSIGRGILIHVTKTAGDATTLGCSGVTNFDGLKQYISEGTMVENIFENDKVGDCKLEENKCSPGASIQDNMDSSQKYENDDSSTEGNY